MSGFVRRIRDVTRPKGGMNVWNSGIGLGLDALLTNVLGVGAGCS